MPPGVHPGHPPMETTTMLKRSYPDSVAFKAEFKELYPLIKPTPDIHERAETMFQRMSRMFKARGIDSAVAYDSVMKALNPAKEEEILYDAYRANFSAEELKAIVEFFKTPAGKHYLEVENAMMMARNTDIDRYVNQTIQRTIMPMAKPVAPAPGGPQSGMPPMPPHHPLPPNAPVPPPAPDKN